MLQALPLILRVAGKVIANDNVTDVSFNLLGKPGRGAQSKKRAKPVIRCSDVDHVTLPVDVEHAA
jgi:hypothetical protein